jgi:hypothetical protein
LFGGAVAAAATAVALTTGAAMAAPHHAPPPRPAHAVAAVELLGAGQEQFAVVNAVSPGRNKGFVDYTNFNVPARSHVWAPSGLKEQLTVVAGGNTYLHTINAGDILTALSNNSVNFKGTGFYNPVPSDTWSIAGNVKGNVVTFTITYGAWAVPAYSATFAGHINFNGSATGTFKDTNNTVGTFSLPAGSFRTVLNFAAPIQRDVINIRFRSADVTYRIPFGNPLGGAEVTWVFSDLFGHKHWAQQINHGPFLNETVEAGPILIG